MLTEPARAPSLPQQGDCVAVSAQQVSEREVMKGKEVKIGLHTLVSKVSIGRIDPFMLNWFRSNFFATLCHRIASFHVDFYL